jgi:hypothetical protein
MTKHLPWTANEGGDIWMGDDGVEHIETIEILDARGEVVARAFGPSCVVEDDDPDFGIDPFTDEEAQENAYLLAAAPDLLAVVRQFAILGSGKCTIGKPLADMARAAINKAHGKLPVDA